MANLLQKIKSLLKPAFPLEPGFHAFHTPPEEPYQYRLHLRVEPDGEGVLIVNASSVLHLNQTATETVYHFIRGKQPGEIAEIISGRYSTTTEQALMDLNNFQTQLEGFIRKSDQEPVTNFGFERHSDTTDISAPYRLDICLNQSADTTEETQPGLNTEVMKAAIKKCYDDGIPHIIFYGDEPTRREDLPELLETAEKLGLVTGLVSCGEKLSSPAYVEKMISCGLDHLIVPLTLDDLHTRGALKVILPLDLYTSVALLVDRSFDYGIFLRELINDGANAFAFVPGNEEFEPLCKELSDFISEQGIALNSDMPLDKCFISATQAASQDDDFVRMTLTCDGLIRFGGPQARVAGDFIKEEWNAIWARRFEEQI